FGLLMAVSVGANVTVAYRVRPPFRPMSLEQQNLERYRVAVEPYLLPVLLLGSGIFGVFAGLSAASRWQTWLLWRNKTSFGQVDPQFGRDISYYAMTYPFQRFVLGFLLTAVVLSLLAAAATHYLFGGVRLQTAGDKVSPGARAHLSVLVGMVLLLKAVAYYLDRFGLVFSERGKVQGASFTDVNAVLPAKNVLIGVAIICALLAFANILVRNILLPGGAVALLVVTAVVFGGVYPAYTQQFRVKPNEIQREAMFIDRNIQATRAAYSIDDVVTTPYAATGTANTAVRTEQGTVANARLLDPNVVSRTFTQLQRQRAYFQFNPSLDIDRYDFGDGTKDYVVGLRELRLAGLADEQRNWINEHLIYTHGNGIVAAPANVVDEGQPRFVVRDLPVRGPEGFELDEPRVYFGEGTTDYSVVATQQEETDGPIGGSDTPNYSYTGTGGVELSNPFRKLAYALKFREKNLLLSGQIDADSKLQYIREPRERVQKVAPFLELDEDPYPAVVDGKILWIVDGYTTSAGYPYAERTTLGAAVRDSQTRGPQLPAEEVNYIRNSVKATVDAFTGKVTLYQFDEQDPVLKTWKKAFGDILEPKSAISPELEKHFRYPEDLFKVQRTLLSKYHITNPQEFFQGDDYWQIPGDPASTTGGDESTQQPATTPAGPASTLLNAADTAQDQPPYYVVQQFPGTKAPSFNLTTAFVANNGQNLTGVASVSGDPGPDYGKIRLLELPATNSVEGPRQIAARFNSDARVRQVLFTLEQGNSTAIPGNLLTLPVGDGLLYVLPIYARAPGNDSFPTLQVVLGSFGNQVASGDTFAQVLDQLFGRSTGRPATPTASPRPGTSPSPTSSLQPLVDAASRAFEDGQRALRENDFAAYGEAQARLQQALQALADASGTAGPAAPSASASAAPSGPSPSPRR
ncbi:MAG: hypothetical protein JWM64_1292, partial [Frankiales bacterium]|nr:hypothetical protein [Frankiales bacterium]